MEVETIRDKVEICEDKKRGRFMIAKQGKSLKQKL